MAYTEEFLKKKFDFLYRRACALMGKHDPCKIRDGSCYSMRLNPQAHRDDPFCCKGCIYLKPDGCSVESLLCKLWMCKPLEDLNGVNQVLRKDYSPLAKKIIRLRKVAARYDLLVSRGSREDSVAQALLGRMKISDVLKMYK